MHATVEHYDFVLFRPSEQLLFRPFGNSFYQYFECLAYIFCIAFCRKLVLKFYQLIQPADFTSSGTSSGKCFEAYVPGRSEYLNIKAES